MTFTIENGQEIVDILYDGFVTCLKIRKPIALDWYDQAGSVGRYYSFTPDYEPIAIHFNEVLAKGDDHQVLSAIAEFLQLFRSGQYSVYIDRNKRTGFELHTGDDPLTHANKQDYNYYPMDENAMFTQPYNKINKEKVLEYEKMILEGARPKAVLFQAFFNDHNTHEDGSAWTSSYDSPLFILDGHHKLLAYQNLKIDAEYVLISRETIGQEESAGRGKGLYFDYEYFLSNPARQHIISHAPLLRVDKSPATLRYNIQLDNYLSTGRYIEIEIVKLFKDAWHSKETAQLAWLHDRLTALEQQVGRNRKMWLNYQEFTPEYPTGRWNGMNIETMDDYKLWIEKILGSTLDEIKHSISQ